MSQPHDFPFDITDVAELLHLRIRRPSPQGLYVDCPICNDKRGKMHINTQTDTWRCNYCDESGGMLALYAKVHSISTSTAYREISDALLNGVNLSDHAVKYPDKPKETPVEAAPAADIAVRHKTYTALLAMLTLSKEHRAHLQTVRGLPDEQIERLGYKTMPPFYMCRSLANRLLQNGHQLDGVPGFYQKDGQWTIASSSFTAGIMIPARTRQGLKATFFGMGFHQPVGILTPCANLKILCMQGLTAADILGNVKAYIRVAFFTGLQFKIGSYPTDNIYLCHSSPFCLTAEISI